MDIQKVVDEEISPSIVSEFKRLLGSGGVDPELIENGDMQQRKALLAATLQSVTDLVKDGLDEEGLDTFLNLLQM